MRIIPAIDILSGKCVRLTKGNYATSTIYSDRPLDTAKSFEDAGLKYLHVVDLDGAKAKQVINHKTLHEIASKTNLQIDFGGGIKSEEDIRIVLESGARQITVGSVAAQNPTLMLEWLHIYGAEKIVLGADCKNKLIATNGWLQLSNIDVLTFIKHYEKNNIKYSIVTDIDKDGMLSGPSFELYKEILSETKINLVASGGITTIDDVKQLKSIGCEGVIIGKAIYEGTIDLKELSELC